MTYKDIIVFLDGTSDCESRLEFAAGLAQSFEARLTGIDVATEAALDGDWAETLVALPDLFEDQAEAAGVRHRLLAARDRADLPSHLGAHYADLLIAGQPGEGPSHYLPPGMPQDVLMSAGVPMLVLPPKWRAPASRQIWRNVVVAWAPSREATRAVHDAMPLLEKAESVTLFAFGASANAEMEPLRGHLQEHGVASQIERWPDTGDLSAIEALFASRGLEEADLIVAGAYGHSPLLERVFGGMSEQLLHQISMPILVSH